MPNHTPEEGKHMFNLPPGGEYVINGVPYVPKSRLTDFLEQLNQHRVERLQHPMKAVYSGGIEGEMKEWNDAYDFAIEDVISLLTHLINQQ